MATKVQKKKQQGNRGVKNQQKKANQKEWWMLATVLVITFIAFFPSLKNSFVNWDDYNYVKDNPVIKDLSAKNIGHIFNTSTYIMGNYHPITILTYCFEYAFFKLDPFFFHLDNILLHLLNIIGVYLFFRLLTGRFDVSFITALLFALHPLRVESVTWVAERKDVLYTLFFLASLCSYILYLKKKAIVPTIETPRFSSSTYYYGSILFFILSALSKGQAVVLAPVLLLIDFFLKRKIDQKAIVEKIPFFILALIFGIIAMKAQNSSLTTERLASHTPFERLLIASYGLVMYLYKFLLPIKLACFYQYPDKISGFFFVAPVIVIAALYGVWRLMKQAQHTVASALKPETPPLKTQTSNWLFFGGAFFFLTISIVLQLLPVGDAIIAERYTYIPFIGIFFFVSSLYTKLIETKPNLKSPLRIGGIAIIAIYFVLTFNQTTVWKDSITLWTSVLENYPETPVAFNNRGQSYFDKPGEIEKKVDVIKTTTDAAKRAQLFQEINSTYGLNLNEQNITAEVAKAKEIYMQKSFEDFNKAIEYKKDYAYAFKNRGAVFQNLKKFDLAVQDYKKALAISPDFSSAMFNLGLNYVDAGKPDSALMYYDMAIKYEPDNPQLYYSKGIAFKAKNKLQEAIESYDKAIEVNPRYSDAFDNRGNVFFNLGQYDKAIADYDHSIEIEPANGRAYSNRSMAFYYKKDFKSALDNAMQAEARGTAMDPRYMEMLKGAH